MKCASLGLGLLLTATLISAQNLFSSSDQLKELFTKEQNTKLKLEQYLKTLNKQIKVVNNMLTTHYSSFNYTKEDSTDYVSNPVNSFVMLKRTGLEWSSVTTVLFNKTLKEDLADLETAIMDFPNEQDIEGAAQGLFLLHETYNLNLSKFANGELEVPGNTEGKIIKGHLKLSVYDLEILGKLSFNRGYYDRAVEWTTVALEFAQKENSKISQKKLSDIIYTLKTMKKKHDLVLDQKGPRGEMSGSAIPWRTYNHPFDPKLAKKKKYKRKGKELRYRPPINLFNVSDTKDMWDNFNALCRGEQLRTLEMDKDLICQYVHYQDPFLRLGPFKIEEKNHAPFISVFHDFLYDAEMDNYRQNVTGKLKRSEHSGKDGSQGDTSIKRTSSQAWLYEHSPETGKVVNKYAVKVSERIKHATRLHTSMVKGGEAYQVANYGIGGVYNHHTDSSGMPLEHATSGLNIMFGDRIATTMGYLSDVIAGGATVFPNVGVSVWPKKGNLVFWYNNSPNGPVDGLTFHGGCPVLAGSKWITNKWIHTFGQWRNFPCNTKPKVQAWLKPVNNDVCKMTPMCDNMDLHDHYHRKEYKYHEIAMLQELAEYKRSDTYQGDLDHLDTYELVPLPGGGLDHGQPLPLVV